MNSYIVIHQNIQSIGNSLNELELFVNNQNASIVAITEHWKSSTELNAYHIAGYRLISKFCRQSGKHGGSAIYLANNIDKCRERSDILIHGSPYVFECSAIQFILENVRYVIVCIYRANTAPYTNADSFLEKLDILLRKLTLEKSKYIILGDFNINTLLHS